MKSSFLLLIILSGFFTVEAQRRNRNTNPQATSYQYDESVFRGIQLRNLNPAKTGGRIADIAVDPKNKSTRFAAVSSGNVWKTTNSGTTWRPVFDHYGSSSIGVVEIDPNNSNVVWIGTGENNAQRSVGLGDGVYKSVDEGESWKNMGLKTSEHIGSIMIDPRNSDVVFVASQGSVWKAGGERGLYKTTDGGESWDRVLHISEETGISDIIYDPRNPDKMWVSSYQRRRHPGILVAGGPDGGIWHTKDGGDTWEKLRSGLPGGDLGRIGLAISPQNPDVLYALIAGTDQTKGFYRSSNGGLNWSKMSDYMVVDAQYYMKIFPDPHQFDRILSVNVMIGVTEDGGKTWSNLNSRNKHVDNHDIVFDSEDPDYIMVGCDGGIYESWDRGDSWKFTDNIPITQYYRVGIDNSSPFYYVYGGTQDSATQGAPNQTTDNNGITNSDWFNVVGGDGFQPRIDPDDPNIVYGESQYAGIVRYDRKSGERVDIQPQPGSGEPPLRWHWDSPLIISPHNGQRLYFAANKLFRSDDRGDSWVAISGDLTQQFDRNRMEVMGRVWGVDAIFKNVWTSPMSTIVALDESPLQEGLLYVGTDDGLIQISENGGESWSKVSSFPGVPANTYVADIHASRTNSEEVFAVFNNHKYGDYKPYFLRSTDRGRTWSSIAGNLPSRDIGWTIYQDHINTNLLFAGTEYGLYFSLDKGKQWIKFTSIPTIPIRDLEIQKREDDLVAASFGRGFYILDDYRLLREISATEMNEEKLFTVRDALSYQMSSPESGSLGDDFYSNDNPAYGAVFSYYLPTTSMSLMQQRLAEERNKVASNQPVYYPDWKDLAAERREDRPFIVFTIKDGNGEVIRRITGPTRKGIHRINWNLRHAGGRFGGPPVAPGTYTVSMARVVNGQWEELGVSQSFEVKKLDNVTLPSTDYAARERQMLEIVDLQSEINELSNYLRNNAREADRLKNIILNHSESSSELYETCVKVFNKMLDFEVELNGNDLMVEKMELIPPSISRRVGRVLGSLSRSSSDLNGTQAESLRVSREEFDTLKKEVSGFSDDIFSDFIQKLNAANISHDLK